MTAFSHQPPWLFREVCVSLRGAEQLLGHTHGRRSFPVADLHLFLAALKSLDWDWVRRDGADDTDGSPGSPCPPFGSYHRHV